MDWFRNKALELIVAGLSVVAVGYISLNFVSKPAYANDQATLVKAINNIAPALHKQLEVARLQREIRETKQLSQRLQRYVDADPDSSLTTARTQEIDVLADHQEDLALELKVLMDSDKRSNL